MHKKLESELMSIAHSILQMKNKNDVMALKNKAQELYERLSVLAFVDEYLETTPDADYTKDMLVSKIELAVKGVFTDPEQVDEMEKEEVPEVVVEEKIKASETSAETDAVLADKIGLALQGVFTEPIKTGESVKEEAIEIEDEILSDKIGLALQGVFTDSTQKDTVVKEEIDEVIVEESVVEPAPVAKKQLSLEEEFKDTVSVEVTQDLFQKVEEKPAPTKATLNDTLMQKNIQVGLNDRIAFVKHLFNHSQADFNRVLSQLNSIDSEKEAKNFITKMVKPDYDWSGKEEYEERLIDLIERKF